MAKITGKDIDAFWKRASTVRRLREIPSGEIHTVVRPGRREIRTQNGRGVVHVMRPPLRPIDYAGIDGDCISYYTSRFREHVSTWCIEDDTPGAGDPGEDGAS